MVCSINICVPHTYQAYISLCDSFSINLLDQINLFETQKTLWISVISVESNKTFFYDLTLMACQVLLRGGGVNLKIYFWKNHIGIKLTPRLSGVTFCQRRFTWTMIIAHGLIRTAREKFSVYFFINFPHLLNKSLALSLRTPQKSQTLSNNSSVVADKLFERV